MSFYLHDNPDSRLRLKSFSATSKGVKSTLRIELETSDAYELGYALERLAKVQAGQRARVTDKPGQSKQAGPLALPAPSPALARANSAEEENT